MAFLPLRQERMVTCWSRVGHVTVTNLDIHIFKNLQAESYDVDTLFTIIKCFTTSAQPISLFIKNFFHTSVKEIPAYNNVHPESRFSSVVERKKRERKMAGFAD